MNKSLICSLIIIGFLGIFLRYDSYKTQHPDNDELYEFRQLISRTDFSRVLDRTTTYGDHTSFPGEFLMYYPLLQRSWDGVVVYVEKMQIVGLSVSDFNKFVIPKAFITLVGMILFGYLCYSFKWVGILGFMIYCFNVQLVYHAVSMRPYSVLPELAVFNIMLAGYCARQDKGWLFYSLLFFITCIYHAFGILIAFLPLLLYFRKMGKFPFVPVILISFFAWAYYASFNTFGFVPNAAQNQVGFFTYMPRVGFFEQVLKALTGGSVIFYALCPILLLRLFVMGRKEWLFLLLMIVLPICLICAVNWKSHNFMFPRYFIWVIPFFIIFCMNTVKDTICHFAKEVQRK